MAPWLRIFQEVKGAAKDEAEGKHSLGPVTAALTVPGVPRLPPRQRIYSSVTVSLLLAILSSDHNIPLCLFSAYLLPRPPSSHPASLEFTRTLKLTTTSRMAQ